MQLLKQLLMISVIVYGTGQGGFGNVINGF